MTFYSTHRYRNYRRPFVSRDDRTIERVEAKLERREAAMQDDNLTDNIESVPDSSLSDEKRKQLSEMLKKMRHDKEDREFPPESQPMSIATAAPAAQSGWPAPASLPGLSDHQREKYTQVAHGSFSLLLGRPGTGKTFSLARILGSIPRGRSAVAAPTGKAAVRITESLNRAGVQGMKATTIHSLLKVTSSDNGWEFEHNEENPLPLDWLFLDESSMLSTSLAASLMAARAPGCRVMWIGDPNQLAPVEHGAPLRDLIAAGVPSAELLEIQRNAGRIVKACHAIIDRKTYEPSEKLDLEAESPENLIHVEVKDPEKQIAKLKGILERFKQGAKLAGQTIDPVWDVSILVPVNAKSPVGRLALNSILGRFLNPTGETVDGAPFKTGDKIILGKNSYVPIETNIPANLSGGPWNENTKDNRCYACNGDVAKVVAVFPRYTVARLWLPDRLVRIPHGKSFENEDGESENSGTDWQAAYAITVNKAQGSENKVVITIIDDFPGARMLCKREWLYTAVSRATMLGITLGQRETAEAMCHKTGIGDRKTFLVDEIRQLQQAGLSQAWESELNF